MTKEKEEKKKPAPAGMLTIEKLGSKTDPGIFAGVCAHNNWAAGRRVKRKVFKQAVASFLSAPAGSFGRKK